MKLFTVKSFGMQFNVHATYHGHSIRDGESRTRMKFYTIRKLKQIFRIAAQSLSEYRNKGRIAITYRTATGRIGALLVALDENDLTIITTLYNVKRQPNDVFRGVPHYYLPNYVFTKPTDKELRTEHHEQQAKFSSKEELITYKRESKEFINKTTNITKPKWN